MAPGLQDIPGTIERDFLPSSNKPIEIIRNIHYIMVSWHKTQDSHTKNLFTRVFLSPTDLQRSLSYWIVPICFLAGLSEFAHAWSALERVQKSIKIVIYLHDYILYIQNNYNPSMKKEKKYKMTYDKTVFVDTIYSTSFVQGLTKLNHWLCRVTKEPYFVLNL